MEASMGNSVILWLLFSAITSPPILAANNMFGIPEDAMCSCPGEVLSFTCSIVGGGSTIWSGTSLECGTGDIILRHDNFGHDISRICNGAIVIESLGVSGGNCYNSQLNITVSDEFNNTSIECLVNDGGRRTIGDSIVTVIPVSAYLQEPIEVSVSDVNVENITFNWIPLNSLCSNMMIYNFISTCGTCQLAIGNKVVCSDLLIPSMCTFSICSTVCGQTGASNSPITVTLKRPGKPQVHITPVYSDDSRSLIRLVVTVNQEPSFDIVDGIPGSVTVYSISYSDSVRACPYVRCEYLVDIDSFICPPSTDIEVNVSASNILGQGPTSDPITIECTNQIADVLIDTTTSSIICEFLDKTNMYTKTCSIKYGQCDPQRLVYVEENNSTLNSPNNVILYVDPGKLNCYEITASNGNTTIIVKGRIPINAETSNVTLLVSVISLGGLLALVMTILILILMVVLIRRRKKGTTGEGEKRVEGNFSWKALERATESQESNGAAAIVRKFMLVKVEADHFKPIIVEENCELKELIEKTLKCEYKRGYAFYELREELESIPEHKKIIFMIKNTNELFSSNITSLKKNQGFQVIRAPLRQSFKEFKIFVQSTGSGVRYLDGETCVLYQIHDNSKPLPGTPLKEVLLSNFSVAKLSKELKIKKGSKKVVFVDLDSFIEEKKNVQSLVRDVILINEQTGKLFTGPLARHMVHERNWDHRSVNQNVQKDQHKWKTFILCYSNQDMEIKQGTEILHQCMQKQTCKICGLRVLEPTMDKDNGAEKFIELTVEDEIVQMAKFVEGEKHRFENGRVFYEFTDIQDLQYCKEVVHLSVKGKKNQYKSGVKLFYAIPETPGEFVKPGSSGGAKVFIQSTSHGTRCLKKGMKLLIKVDGTSV